MTKLKKTWLIIIGVLFLAVGTWLYTLNRKNKTGVTPTKANIKDLKVNLAQARVNAKTSFAQASVISNFATLASKNFTNSLLTNYAEGGFASPTFLPMTDATSTKFSLANKDGNLAKLNALVAKYDTEVTRQSVLWKVPRWMIYGIMLNENTDGIADKTNTDVTERFTSDSLTGKKGFEFARPYGLGQVKPKSATDTLRIAIKNGILQIDHATALQNLANGDKIDKALSKTQLGDIIISPAELIKPEFNIAMICANLATLMLEYGTELYKISASYNQGYFFIQLKGLKKYKSFQTFYGNCSSEPQQYLLNTCGKYGSFTLAVFYANIKD